MPLTDWPEQHSQIGQNATHRLSKTPLTDRPERHSQIGQNATHRFARTPLTDWPERPDRIAIFSPAPPGGTICKNFNFLDQTGQKFSHSGNRLIFSSRSPSTPIFHLPFRYSIFSSFVPSFLFSYSVPSIRFYVYVYVLCLFF